MQELIILIVLAFGAATVIAAAVFIPGAAMLRTWVRRMFLVLINLSPWTFGIWRTEFSSRETFLAAWFLAFVAALIGFALLRHHVSA
jgi:hypothetical protein